MPDDCPFCTLTQRRIVASNDLTAAIRNAYPVSAGHTLIVPRRHIGSFFAISAEERDAMLGLLDAAKAALDAEFHPDGYNIGINDGAAAGQTIGHLHLHFIPRYPGIPVSR